jgi:hypothetical protein
MMGAENPMIRWFRLLLFMLCLGVGVTCYNIYHGYSTTNASAMQAGHAVLYEGQRAFLHQVCPLFCIRVAAFHRGTSPMMTNCAIHNY